MTDPQPIQPLPPDATVTLPMRTVLDWLMVSDPWPLTDDAQTAIVAALNERAATLGYADWVTAYHEGGRRLPVGEVRVIFDLDPDTGEATGTVHPFCSDECRDAFIPDNIPHVAHGRSSIDDFGFIPKCEQCGKFTIGCDQCGSEQIPGVLTGMNWVGDPTGGVQACGNCAQYPGDLDAVLALAKHLGRNAWFVRHDHTTDGHVITKVTDEVVAAEEDDTWSIAERTDPWVGEWDSSGYHLDNDGPAISPPPKEEQ